MYGAKKQERRHEWAKKYNQSVYEYKDKVFEYEKWKEIKKEIMYEILVLKFTSDIKCQKVLSSLKGYDIREDSPYDMYWGGRGQNILGELLVKLSHEL